jgi:hypothetical protein
MWRGYSLFQNILYELGWGKDLSNDVSRIIFGAFQYLKFINHSPES